MVCSPFGEGKHQGIPSGAAVPALQFLCVCHFVLLGKKLPFFGKNFPFQERLMINRPLRCSGAAHGMNRDLTVKQRVK
jgi:hypothetical protein